jgi:hypothetical protein
VEILFSNVGWVVGIIGEGGATVNRKKNLKQFQAGRRGRVSPRGRVCSHCIENNEKKDETENERFSTH